MEVPQGSATRIFRKEANRWYNFREADAFSVKNRFLYRDPSRVSKIKHSSDTIKGHKINFKRLTKGIPMDDSEDILGSNGSPKDPGLRGIFFRSYRNLSFKEVKNFYEYNSFLSFQILF